MATANVRAQHWYLNAVVLLFDGLLLKAACVLHSYNLLAIEDRNIGKKRTKADEKSSVFSRLDFGSILGGFGEGFGMPKSFIFAFFSFFF